METVENKQISSAAKGLRIVGTLIVVAAALSFLIQSWNDPSALMRYYSFLGFAGLLGCAGILSGMRLKDSKGARTFLALGISFIPALFAQVGGFIFAFYGSPPASFPSALVYQGTPLEAALALAAAIVLALPIMRIGFATLCREHWQRLAGAFLAGNTVLLLPMRDPLVVSLLAGALGAFLISQDLNRFALAPRMSHFEGKLSRCLLFLPLTILVARLCLYDFSSFTYALVVGGLGAACFIYSPSIRKDQMVENASRLTGVALMFDGWRNYIGGVKATLAVAGYGDYINAISVPATCLPFAVLLAALSYHVGTSGRGYRRLAAYLAVLPMIWQMLTVGGLVSAMATVVVSTFVICWSLAVAEDGILFSGILGLVVGLAYHLKYAHFIFIFSPWVSLAIFGTLAIFGAAYVERHSNELKSLSRRFEERFAHKS